MGEKEQYHPSHLSDVEFLRPKGYGEKWVDLDGTFKGPITIKSVDDKEYHITVNGNYCRHTEKIHEYYSYEKWPKCRFAKLPEKGEDWKNPRGYRCTIHSREVLQDGKIKVWVKDKWMDGNNVWHYEDIQKV